jgi:acetylornithine deacetylase/succinyl-diaminopimelate desuccinylase-like protein
VEIRAIPNDRLAELMEEFEEYAFAEALEITERVFEPGTACDPDNRWLRLLVDAVRLESAAEPVIGRKLAGTSARFAPGGNGVVWGQSGIGPHSAQERHYIPSIEPYYRALDTFGKMTMTMDGS